MPSRIQTRVITVIGQIRETCEALNTEELNTINKSAIPTIAKTLSLDEINFLVQELNEKNDTLRYNAFLLLQSASRELPMVYRHWSTLEKKLEDPNSYQRSLGIMLIAENVRWDEENKFSKTFSKYMVCCNDEKFVTARQAIQGLQTIANTTDKFDAQIKHSLSDLQFTKYKANQQKLLAKDVSNTLSATENKRRPAK